MAARYRSRTSEDFNGAPVLVMTVQTEQELLLTNSNIQALRSVVESYFDGQNALVENDRGLWLSALRSFEDLQAAADIRQHYSVGLSSDWVKLPSKILDIILADYTLNADKHIRIYTEGPPLAATLVFQIGANAAKFALPKESLARCKRTSR
jgi:hypothetical protein